MSTRFETDPVATQEIAAVQASIEDLNARIDSLTSPGATLTFVDSHPSNEAGVDPAADLADPHVWFDVIADPGQPAELNDINVGGTG